MPDMEKLIALVEELGNDKERFKTLLEQFIKLIINQISTTGELREEIKDVESLNQICISDLNLRIWIKINKGTLEYGFDKVENPDLMISLTKKNFIKMAARRIGGRDSYMRGKIKVEGSLTQGMKFLKTLGLFYEYLNNIYSRKKK